MVMSSNNTPSGLSAYRCPNAEACPKTRTLSDHQCAREYHDGSFGCTICEPGYGRDSLEPFTCRKCGNPAYIKIIAVVGAGIPFLLGLDGARRSAIGSQYSSTLKILISYTCAAALVVDVLDNTKAFERLRNYAEGRVVDALENSRLFNLETPSRGALALSGVSPFSLDCVLEADWGYKFPGKYNLVVGMFFMDTCVPLSLLTVTMFLLALRNCGDLAEPATLARVVVRPFLVFVNAFIPALTGAVFRAYPCFHMQEQFAMTYKERIGKEYMAFAVEVSCNTRPDWSNKMLFFGSIACICVGPLSWKFLLWRSKSWPSKMRNEILGFLKKEYIDTHEEWEVVVLCRKMAFMAIAVACPKTYSTSTHIALLMTVFGAALVAHARCWPFRNNALNILEFTSLLVVTFSMMCASFVDNPSWSMTPQCQERIMVAVLGLIASMFVVLVSAVLYTLFEHVRGDHKELGNHK